MKNNIEQWVRRDYREGFRWSNVKEKYPHYGVSWFLVFYICLIIPQFLEMTDNWVEAVYYLAIMGPIIFAYFSHTLHQTWLPKMMLLCPLTSNERRTYVVKSIRYRMALHFLIGSIGVIGILIFRPFDWLLAAMIFINLFFVTYYTCGTNKKVYTKEVPMKKVKDAGAEVSVQELMDGTAIFISFASGMIYFFLMFWSDGEEIGNTPVAWWVKLLFLAIELSIQIPIFINYQKYRKAVIEDACRYEGGYV